MPRDPQLQENIDQFETFLHATLEARTDSERDRDYVDHKQWTADDVETLQKRNQAPTVFNKIKTKVNLLSGIQRQRRTDPKALPRTPQHEDDADSVTDAVRFVADNNDFQQIASDAFIDKIVWGYSGAIVEVDPDREFEVRIRDIPADRYYFDPHSRKLDFSDKRFDGIVAWLDEDVGKELFPDKAEDIEQLVSIHSDELEDETFEDKPDWVDRKTRRFRVCQHYFIKNGVWHEAYFAANMYLVEPKPSPYQDERGEPANPIEAQTAYINRDNDRYGEVRQYIWPQDDLNHRRSKALYALSVRQTTGEKGAVDDINEAKRQLALANGHVETNPGKNFEILPNDDQIQGQIVLYEDSVAQIDTVGANAALGASVDQPLSGRALQTLQQGGIAELGALFDQQKGWERRIYRQIWSRIKQFWTEERWIRVTDNEDNLRWVVLNQPITMGDTLRERAEAGDERAQAQLQANLNNPALNEIVGVRRNTSEMDVDFIMVESPDFATLRQEQFDTLANLAQAYGPEAVPFDVMLKLSDLPHKREVEDLLNPPDDQGDPVAEQAQQQLAAELAKLEFEERQAEVAKLQADADKTRADVEATEAKTKKDLADAAAQEIENDIVRRGIIVDPRPQLTVNTGA